MKQKEDQHDDNPEDPGPCSPIIFNNTFEILGILGEGNTSKVLLAKSMKNEKHSKYAIKVFKTDFINS